MTPKTAWLLGYREEGGKPVVKTLTRIPPEEFRRRCREMKAVIFDEPAISSEEDLEMAILRLKANASAVARHMKLPDAMELLHDVGMIVHKAARR